MALFAGEEQQDVYTPHRLSAWGPVLGLEDGRPTPLEDRELAAHFGPEYALYAHRVARLFPN